jgi:hypothetical protein
MFQVFIKPYLLFFYYNVKMGWTLIPFKVILIIIIIIIIIICLKLNVTLISYLYFLRFIWSTNR